MDSYWCPGIWEAREVLWSEHVAETKAIKATIGSVEKAQASFDDTLTRTQLSIVNQGNNQVNHLKGLLATKVEFEILRSKVEQMVQDFAKVIELCSFIDQGMGHSD